MKKIEVLLSKVVWLLDKKAKKVCWMIRWWIGGKVR